MLPAPAPLASPCVLVHVSDGLTLSDWLPMTGDDLLGPLPHLSSFTLQPAHALLSPLGPHPDEGSQLLAPGHSSKVGGSYLVASVANCRSTFFSELNIQSEGDSPGNAPGLHLSFDHVE